jgi:hypothetical protein
MALGPYEIQTGDDLRAIAVAAGMTLEQVEAANPNMPIKNWWRTAITWTDAGAVVWLATGGDLAVGSILSDGNRVVTTDGDGANARQFIQSGVAAVTGNVSGDSLIAFPTAFATPPVVTLLVRQATTQIMDWWLSSAGVTVNGFTIRIYRNSVAWAGTADVHWIAIGDRA